MKPVLLFIYMAAIGAGCAARSVPSTFPRGAAAAPATPEAPRHPVLTTLRSDPPLPGEPSTGWAGLAEGGADGAPADPQPATSAPAPVAGGEPVRSPQPEGDQPHAN